MLKFAKDRQCWLRWLFEARRRHSLLILNYMVTSNHIHLLVVDDGDRDVIPKSIRLVAGRTVQEFNQRKNRPDKSGSSTKEHSGRSATMQRRWKEENIFFVAWYILTFTLLNSLGLACTTPRFYKATKMVGSTPALLKISN